MIYRERRTTINKRYCVLWQDHLTNTYEIGVRFKYHDGYIANRMKLTRSIWQSCNILVGMATDELDLEHNGKMNGMGCYITGYGLKSGVW